VRTDQYNDHLSLSNLAGAFFITIFIN